MDDFDPHQVALAAKWAARYLEMGYNPLPARPIDGRIRPALRKVSTLREVGVGESIVAKWWAPAIQNALGVKFGIAVVDLDSALAIEVYNSMALHRPKVRTWAVRHDPRGGMHLWFENPPGLVLPFKTVIWSLEGEKHCAIEVLGDRNLIVSPPSVSPKSGRPYEFLPGHGPDDIDRPAPLPAWVVDMVYRSSEKRPTAHGAQFVPKKTAPLRHTRGRGVYYRREDVLDAIRDKISLAERLGVRIASRDESDTGWVRCHSVFREDRNPSAGISARTGSYWESDRERRPLSIFDLMVHFGAARDLPDAIRQLGETYIGDGNRAGSQEKPEGQRTSRPQG